MTVNKLGIWKKIILFPFAVIFSVLVVNINFIVILPVCYIVFSVYKYVIILLAKCFRPNYSKMLKLQDRMMAKENFYEEVDLYQSVKWYFEGNLVLEDFMKLFEERVLNKKLPNGQLKFPELQTCIEPFMGYFFYKKDKNFDLKNHIELYKHESSDSVVNRKKLENIVQEFTNKLYQKERSPWGVLIVNNCRLDDEDGKEYSVVIGKNHHCIGDAYAGLLMFWKALFQQELKPFGKRKENVRKPNLLQIISSVFGAARDFYWTLITFAFLYIYNPGRLYDENDWHTRDTSSVNIHTNLPPIPTSLVKEICSECNISITTVLLAIVTGGFQRMMEANGLKTPKNMRIAYSLPMPSHPDRLTTFSSVTFFDYNFDCPDEQNRLETNEKGLKRGTRWSLLFALPFMSFFLDPWPLAWKWHFPAKSYSLSSSSFVANAAIPTPPSGEVEFLGCRLVRVYGTCEQSASKTNAPTVVAVLKYKDGFFIDYAIQKHLLSYEDQIYKIESYILEELAHLRKSLLGTENESPKSAGTDNGYDNSEIKITCL